MGRGKLRLERAYNMKHQLHVNNRWLPRESSELLTTSKASIPYGAMPLLSEKVKGLLHLLCYLQLSQPLEFCIMEEVARSGDEGAATLALESALESAVDELLRDPHQVHSRWLRLGREQLQRHFTLTNVLPENVRDFYRGENYDFNSGISRERYYEYFRGDVKRWNAEGRKVPLHYLGSTSLRHRLNLDNAQALDDFETYTIALINLTIERRLEILGEDILMRNNLEFYRALGWEDEPEGNFPGVPWVDKFPFLQRIALIPLSRFEDFSSMVEEYNWEWAAASFDWDERQ